MKTIIMRTDKSSRWAAMLLATVVAIITSLTVANATQTITTPNAAFISFNLAGIANSPAITLASNRSVQVMGCCTTAGNQGVAQVSLLHIPTVGAILGGIAWVGLESQPMAGITQGFTNISGTHIAFIDIHKVIDIEIAGPDTILVHNFSTLTETGNVTLIW